MDALTPDDHLAENQLICEKLLGWQRWQEPGMRLQWKQILDGGAGWMINDTPSFTTWAEAGLILDAFKARKLDTLELSVDDEGDWRAILEWDRHEMHRSRYSSESAPIAIRKAALSYIEAARL